MMLEVTPDMALDLTLALDIQAEFRVKGILVMVSRLHLRCMACGDNIIDYTSVK